jgi:DNA-binding response OmpR family regulator
VAPMGQPFVLIIDDDAASSAQLHAILTAEGYSVDTISDTDRGLKIAGTLRPKLVIIDLNAPGTNVAAFLEALYAKLEHCPVVLVGAAATLPVVAQSRGLEYLAKPFDKAALLATARKLIEP